MENVPNVSVYWDFENMHASLVDLEHGQGAYKKNLYFEHPQLIDVGAVMEYVSTLGRVNINRAYGNWQSFSRYAFQLQMHSVDLIQMFHKVHGKNGADIRMAIDIIEDLGHNKHIDIVVVVGGDSDYVAVAQKVRQTGREIVGIGVRGSTSNFLIQSCNEFKFYETLLVKASSQGERPMDIEESEGPPKTTLEDAKALLRRAITALSQKTGSPSVLKAAVKPMMMRLDSSFDEANFGYQSFSELLEDCSDIVVITKGEKDHLLTLRDNAPLDVLEDELPGRPQAFAGPPMTITLTPSFIRTAAIATAAVFEENEGIIHGFEEFKARLLAYLSDKTSEATPDTVSKFKNLLYQYRSFSLLGLGRGIALGEDAKTAPQLLALLGPEIVRQYVRLHDGPPDQDELVRLLFVEPPPKDEAERVISRYVELARR